METWTALPPLGCKLYGDRAHGGSVTAGWSLAGSRASGTHLVFNKFICWLKKLMKESHPQKVTIEMSIKTVLHGHNEELLNKREERYHHTHLLSIYLNVGNIQPFTPKYILYKPPLPT